MAAENHTAILVVAAGASRRLGQPKQLLPFRGTTLLNHTLETCLASGVGDVHLVLGAHREEIAAQLLDGITVSNHENWADGMGTSIAYGVRELLDYSAVIIVVGDQPFLESHHLLQLTEARLNTPSQIIVSAYERGQGPPVLFTSVLFPELQKLSGDQGAKPLLKTHPGPITTVPFPRGHVDIDRPTDLPHLQ